MKVLIVSAYFPPGNAIGAVRLGKLAAHLSENGCDVRVISAIDKTLPQTLPVEINPENVIATKWFDLHTLPRMLLQRSRPKDCKPVSAGGGRLTELAFNLFRALFHWPDRHIGWFFPARKAGKRLFVDWKPDVIYASAWPITALFVGASLSREYSIPWVAELRDLWLDNHYHPIPAWRRWIDRALERRLLTSASLLVTVSEPLAENLKKKFLKPTAVVLNGYDATGADPGVGSSGEGILTITYTGMIYPGRRDPSPLFEALRKMGPLSKRVRVKFYGRILPGVQALIQLYGLDHCVEVLDPVPYKEALRIQSESDILLLLLWDTPEERGVYTGKLFEYLGARRPILSLGLENGVAAELIRTRAAGAVSNDPDIIVDALKNWLEQKSSTGEIPALPATVNAGLSRKEQFDMLLPHIKSLLGTRKKKPKVVIVTRKLDVGGSERHLAQILPSLGQKFDIDVLVIRAGGRMEHELIEMGISVKSPPPVIGTALGRVWSACWLTLILLRNRDAIAHFFLPEAYLVGGICGVLVRHQRMIMSRRSLNEYQTHYPRLTKIEKKLHSRMCYVLGNSQAVMQNLYYEGVSSESARLIYNGVDIAPQPDLLQRSLLRSKFGISENDLVFIVVANLIAYKGHADLIKALGTIAGKMIAPWRLLIVGRDDGIRASLEETAKEMGISDNIIFTGEFVSARDLWSVGDIGVLPSHQEGFSNSILEGMSACLPMVVTNVGGNAEAVLHGETGLVVSPHCPEQLGEALYTLASDPEKRRIYGVAARSRVERDFSVDNCIEEYKRVYESVLSSGDTV